MNIVAIGDSTTAGTPGFRSPLEAPPAGLGDVTSQYAYWLRQMHPEWSVANCGINAEPTRQIRSRLARDVLDVRGVDVAIIIAGVNDIYEGCTPDVVIPELAGMYHEVCAAGIHLVAGTILPFNTSTRDQRDGIERVNAWIRSIDLGDMYMVADTAAAVAAPDNPMRLISSPDGLHPSVDGYRRMALAIESAIDRMFCARTGADGRS